VGSHDEIMSLAHRPDRDPYEVAGSIKVPSALHLFDMLLGVQRFGVVGHNASLENRI
jgi:hypothetical protein